MSDPEPSPFLDLASTIESNTLLPRRKLSSPGHPLQRSENLIYSSLPCITTTFDRQHALPSPSSSAQTPTTTASSSLLTPHSCLSFSSPLTAKGHEPRLVSDLAHVDLHSPADVFGVIGEGTWMGMKGMVHQGWPSHIRGRLLGGAKVDQVIKDGNAPSQVKAMHGSEQAARNRLEPSKTLSRAWDASSHRVDPLCRGESSLESCDTSQRVGGRAGTEGPARHDQRPDKQSTANSTVASAAPPSERRLRRKAVRISAEDLIERLQRSSSASLECDSFATCTRSKNGNILESNFPSRRKAASSQTSVSRNTAIVIDLNQQFQAPLHQIQQREQPPLPDISSISSSSTSSGSGPSRAWSTAVERESRSGPAGQPGPSNLCRYITDTESRSSGNVSPGLQSHNDDERLAGQQQHQHQHHQQYQQHQHHQQLQQLPLQRLQREEHQDQRSTQLEPRIDAKQQQQLQKPSSQGAPSDESSWHLSEPNQASLSRANLLSNHHHQRQPRDGPDQSSITHSIDSPPPRHTATWPKPSFAAPWKEKAQPGEFTSRHTDPAFSISDAPCQDTLSLDLACASTRPPSDSLADRSLQSGGDGKSLSYYPTSSQSPPPLSTLPSCHHQPLQHHRRHQPSHQLQDEENHPRTADQHPFVPQIQSLDHQSRHQHSQDDPLQLAFDSLSSRPLLMLDVRALSSYKQEHISSSIHLHFPSLIAKRYCKKTASSLDGFHLSSFISSEMGKRRYSQIIQHTVPKGCSDNERRSPPQVAPPALHGSTREEQPILSGLHTLSSSDQGTGTSCISESSSSQDFPGPITGPDACFWKADVVVVCDEVEQSEAGASPISGNESRVSPPLEGRARNNASAAVGEALLHVLERVGLANCESSTQCGDSSSGGGVYCIAGGFEAVKRAKGSSLWLSGETESARRPEDAEQGSRTPPLTLPQSIGAMALSTRRSSADGLTQSVGASPEEVHGLSPLNSSPQRSRGLSIDHDQGALSDSFPPPVPPPSRSLARPGRPSLARLDTSERIKTLNALATLGDLPAMPRLSPNAGLKLQLSPSVSQPPQAQAATLASTSCVNPASEGSLDTNVACPDPQDSFQALRRSQPSVPPSASSFGKMCIPIDPLPQPHATSTIHQGQSRNAKEDLCFNVSTILPGFLFLGPDVQEEPDVEELRKLGVKRILNVAREIEHGGQQLALDNRFEKYLKIPMMDSVEAKGVQQSIQEACCFLDEARMHFAPTYVHCKAGKSRSVTIVMAYLIHANRWSLRKSYSFVLNRRQGISPNIGFVAELMKFEEKELNLEKSGGIMGYGMEDEDEEEGEEEEREKEGGTASRP